MEPSHLTGEIPIDKGIKRIHVLVNIAMALATGQPQYAANHVGQNAVNGVK